MENNKQNYEELAKRQIIRIDASKTFLEVMDTSFNIGKVRINFIEYDKNGTNKQTKNIPIYIKISDAYRIAGDIKYGRILGLYQHNLKNNQGNLTTIGNRDEYTFLGGTHASSLANKKDKDGNSLARPDGAPESRVMKIQCGKSIMFRAELGAGKVNETNGISPAYGNKPEVAVTVAMSEIELKRFAYMLEARLNAYMVAQEVARVQSPVIEELKQALLKSTQDSKQENINMIKSATTHIVGQMKK